MQKRDNTLFSGLHTMPTACGLTSPITAREYSYPEWLYNLLLILPLLQVKLSIYTVYNFYTDSLILIWIYFHGEHGDNPASICELDLCTLSRNTLVSPECIFWFLALIILKFKFIVNSSVDYSPYICTCFLLWLFVHWFNLLCLEDWVPLW